MKKSCKVAMPNQDDFLRSMVNDAIYQLETLRMNLDGSNEAPLSRMDRETAIMVINGKIISVVDEMKLFALAGSTSDIDSSCEYLATLNELKNSL